MNVRELNEIQLDELKATYFYSNEYDYSIVNEAGLPIFKNGEQEWGNTGTMVSQLTKVGFKDVTKSINLANGNGTQKGDVLLNTASHTAMVVSPGTIVHASINEKGTIKGGESGDQTKKEICTRNYYNKPWNYVLRYTG